MLMRLRKIPGGTYWLYLANNLFLISCGGQCIFLQGSLAKPNLLVSEAELSDVDEAEAVAHAHAHPRHEAARVDEPDVVGHHDQPEADHVRHGVHVEGALPPPDGVGQEAGGQGAEGQAQLR